MEKLIVHRSLESAPFARRQARLQAVRAIGTENARQKQSDRAREEQNAMVKGQEITACF
jgi:hypothetical protein